jgi:hypothetical protein
MYRTVELRGAEKAAALRVAMALLPGRVTKALALARRRDERVKIGSFMIVDVN